MMNQRIEVSGTFSVRTIDQNVAELGLDLTWLDRHKFV